MKLALALVTLAMILQSPLSRAADPQSPLEPHTSWNFSEAGLIPVQSGGRLKPFDSYAREMVLYLVGSRSYEGWNPEDLMFSWLTYPTAWDQVSFIQVGREDVRRQLGLDEKRSHFTPHELIGNFALAQYASELEKNNTVTAPTGAVQKQDQRQQELKRVLERVGVFRSIVSGEGWPIIPQEQPKPWLNIAVNDASGKFIRSEFVELVKAYQSGDGDAFKRNSVLVRAAVEGEINGFNDNERHKLEAESFYNRTHPFMYAWIFYLIAALAWFTRIARSESIVETNTGKSIFGQIAAFSMTLAVLAHVAGFGLRCYIAGRPPVTNMYESVIWVSFGVVMFATVIYFVSKRQMIALAVACSLATLGLIAGDAAPAILDPGIHPLVPVLRSNYWLTIHVLTITLGYAAFFLSLGLADVTIFKFIQGEEKNRTQILAMNQLTYRAMQFGVVLIAAGTILGGIWADYSWGRFWGWDPKEVWALIVLLCYLVILHGRYANWVGQFGFAAWSVVSFLSVLMAWYGVNFILGVGLHSYGFSTGGFTAVVSFTVLQLSYVAFAALKRSRFMKAVQA
jgi:cytochrome c-type biogenesis protein CcsB